MIVNFNEGGKYLTFFFDSEARFMRLWVCGKTWIWRKP